MEEKKNIGIKRINNFILYKKLGEGSFGEVYLAKNLKLNILTAVKVINIKKLKEVTEIKKFNKQLQILARLNHNNIIKIIDKQKTNNNYYIELDYCNGPNLLGYLNHYKKVFHKPLSEYIVQKITKQIAEGLEYLHSQKIIHRDIKLENIMINFDDIVNTLDNKIEKDIIDKKIIYSSKNFNKIGNLLTENFTIKICDFGFAREVDENLQASTILGTPLTMAPDILFLKKGSNHYGIEADIWSFGICIYELLIGKPPFFKKDIKNLISEINKGIFDYPKEIEISFESISFINGLLQFNPKKRMNWENIKNHPFITKDPKYFHSVQLTLKPKINEKLKNFIVNSKEKDHYIWMIFNDGSKIGYELDKIDDNFLKVNFEEDYFEINNEFTQRDQYLEKISYSFIDLTPKEKNSDNKKKDSQFFIYNGFNQRSGSDEWEIISTSSQEFE